MMWCSRWHHHPNATFAAPAFFGENTAGAAFPKKQPTGPRCLYRFQAPSWLPYILAGKSGVSGFGPVPQRNNNGWVNGLFTKSSDATPASWVIPVLPSPTYQSSKPPYSDASAGWPSVGAVTDTEGRGPGTHGCESLSTEGNRRGSE